MTSETQQTAQSISREERERRLGVNSAMTSPDPKRRIDPRIVDVSVLERAIVGYSGSRD